jgi:hypothetical protein
MDNINQCPNELIYNSFAIIQIQTFCADELQITTSDFVKEFADPIDEQIFTHQLQFYKRYELKGFNIKIDIDDDEKTTLEGYVHVRAIKFFDTCIQLSYRFVVVENGQMDDKCFCKINHPFNTDQLIAAAGISQKVEYWSVDKETGKQTIDGIVKKVSIWDLHLDENSVYSDAPSTETVFSLDEVMERYRHYFDKNSRAKDSVSTLMHTFIDVCDNIGHSGDFCFDDTISEAKIIEHIETQHKPEIIGLMSLYPREWPYRMDSSYNDICGRNIAIDTDDLVLTNQNISLVIGTYGKRGGNEVPVNWTEHLKRRDAYHVCWPEYMILIELILAKKQTINYAITRYVEKSTLISGYNQNTRKMIEANAKLSVELSNVILQLDSIRYLRYVSHKHMFKLAEENLDVPNDEQYLNEVINKIDNSLNNANNSIELKQAQDTNRILLIISLASLFGVLLQNDTVPIIKTIFSPMHGLVLGAILLFLTFMIIGLVIYVLIKYYVKDKKESKNENKKIQR